MLYNIVRTCSRGLTYESVYELLYCDHSYETSSVVLLHGTTVHFTVVCLMALPLSGSGARGDLALIQTFQIFMLIMNAHAN